MSSSTRRALRCGAAALSMVAATIAAGQPALAAESAACDGFRLYEVSTRYADEYEADDSSSSIEAAWPMGNKLIGKGGARANGWVPIDYLLNSGGWSPITEGPADVHDFVYKTRLDFIKCL